jgi:hypothetical protein
MSLVDAVDGSSVATSPTSQFDPERTSRSFVQNQDFRHCQFHNGHYRAAGTAKFPQETV